MKSERNRLKCDYILHHAGMRCNRVVTRKVINKRTGAVSYRCASHAAGLTQDRGYDQVNIGK